jgi:hypothetical protein
LEKIMLKNNGVNIINYDIGIALWSMGDELGRSISNTLSDMGHNVLAYQYGEKIPEVDILLTYGPFGSLTPISNQLARIKSDQQPVFILWLTEQFPNPDLPEWIRLPASILRLELERASYTCNNGSEWEVRTGAQKLLNKGLRFRYYGELQWLKQSGIPTILVIPSKWTAEFLRQRGFDPVVACIRSLPCKISAQAIKRDIPVLWLGKPGSQRRKRLLKQIRSELAAQGVEMKVVDGVENPYVFGKERTKLLRRTKIALNLLREPWDDNSLRFFFAAENHVLIVSEPSLPHSPFLPGRHVIEVPIDQLTETIIYYLSNDEARREITDSANRLVTEQLTMENSLSKILKRVGNMRAKAEAAF